MRVLNGFFICLSIFEIDHFMHKNLKACKLNKLAHIPFNIIHWLEALGIKRCNHIRFFFNSRFIILQDKEFVSMLITITIIFQILYVI